MSYPVADAHADVLMRVTDEAAQFYSTSTPESSAVNGQEVEGSELQANYERLQSGHVALQVFALYVSPHLPESIQLQQVLRQIDTFHQEVVRPGYVRHVVSQRDLASAWSQGEIAGVLSLEGGGCLMGQPAMVRMLHRLGVRGLGLTWNPANRLADGCAETRNAGLTDAGMQVVQQVERLPMWIDLAHLGEQSTAEILNRYQGPLMASHANARSVYDHRRNLRDPVIMELIQRNGWMGLTFQSSFLGVEETASLDVLGAHIDHVLALGGSDCLGFGSDYDGGIHPVGELPDASTYAILAEWLEHRYGTVLTRKLLADNLVRFLHSVLEP